MASEGTYQVHFLLPTERRGCEVWLQSQQPEVVADCFDLSQASYSALQRQVGDGEVARLVAEAADLRSRLDNFSLQQAEAVRDALVQEKARHKTEIDSKEADIQELDRKWRKSISEQAEFFAAHERSLEESLKKERANALEDMQARCARLTEELEKHESKSRLIQAELKECFAAEKDTLQKQLSQQLEIQTKEQAHQLDLKNQALQQQSDLVGKLWNELSEKQKEMQELHNLMRVSMERQAETTRQLQTQKEVEVQKLVLEKEQVMSQYQEFVSNFRSSASQGKLGEDFVSRVHADMALGTWEDTSHRPEEGYADAMWTLELSGSRKMRCLVEVKNVASLNPTKDLQKFDLDVSQGVRMGAINAAVIVSLRARIPGTKPLHLSIEHGIPVLRLSRESDDVLPARTLVQLGFTTLASAWPLIQNQRGDDQDQGRDVLNAASAFLDEQLSKTTKLSKNIDELEKQARALNRIASDLKKTRDCIVKSVDCIRVQYPQLLPEFEEEVTDINTSPWSDARSQLLLDAVLTHKVDHGNRYPKSMEELGELPEEVRAFCCQHPGLEFKDVLQRAKARVPKGRKRSRHQEDAQNEASADE